VTEKRTIDTFKAKHDPETVIAGLRGELRAALAQAVDGAAIKEILGTLTAKLDVYQPPEWLGKAIKRGDDSPGVPTLFLSDIHYGETVFPGQVNGVNEFNLTIARARMRRTVEKAIHLCRLLSAKMNFPGFVLPLGGDMISGDIHEELATTNELASIPTVLELFDLLVSVIDRLLEEFPFIFIPCVGGNHGRNTKKTWAKNRNHTSFDWMLYQMLARHYKARGETRVTFFIPDGPDALYRIYGYKILLTHGDQFKAGDSIIGALGPIMRGDQKKRARNQAVNMVYDMIMMGHWHQYSHSRRILVNGSMKGYDEYAYFGNFGYEAPTQAFFMTHPKYNITWAAPVLCDEPKDYDRKAKWVTSFDGSKV
jgi:predicted phosphodiesterase